MDLKEIYYKYAKEGLELKDILKVWKEEKLSPERIRRVVASDTGIKVSSGDAKFLYKIARSDDFNYKEAEVNISWELGEREAEDGTKKFYIIRKEKQPTKTASIKEANTSVMSDFISISPNEMQLYPITCPAQKNNIEDCLKDREGKCVCILGKEFCKYFEDATISEIKHERDINCKITSVEK